MIALHTAVRELQDEVETPDSILNRSGDNKKAELKQLTRNCSKALRKLSELLTKYKSLGTNSKRTWDRIKFGLEGLQDIRDQLLVHTSSLTLFLQTLSTSSLGRIEKKLDELIEDVRLGRREPSVLTFVESDNREADDQWVAFKQELLDDAFTRAEVEANKHWIKARLRELIGHGGLEEQPIAMPKNSGSSTSSLHMEVPPAAGSGTSTSSTTSTRKFLEPKSSGSESLAKQAKTEPWKAHYRATVEDYSDGNDAKPRPDNSSSLPADNQEYSQLGAGGFRAQSEDSSTFAESSTRPKAPYAFSRGERTYVSNNLPRRPKSAHNSSMPPPHRSLEREPEHSWNSNHEWEPQRPKTINHERRYSPIREHSSEHKHETPSHSAKPPEDQSDRSFHAADPEQLFADFTKEHGADPYDPAEEDVLPVPVCDISKVTQYGPIHYLSLPLTLEQLYAGVNFETTVCRLRFQGRRKVVTATTLHVTIEPGADDGSTIEFPNYGNEVENFGIQDLHFRLEEVRRFSFLLMAHLPYLQLRIEYSFANLP